MADEEARRYGAGARTFHWLVALLVVVQIPVGIAMTSEGFPTIGDALFIYHKGMGSVLLVLIGARVAWRLTHPAPPMPGYVPEIERRIAGLTHLAIYVLLLVMPLSGYVRTVTDGFPIELLDLAGVPPLLPRMPEVARTARVVHAFSAYSLVTLIALHLGAVMYHLVVLRDGIIWRIWPPLGPKDARITRGPVVGFARAVDEGASGAESAAASPSAPRVDATDPDRERGPQASGEPGS